MTTARKWLDDPDFQRLAERNARRLGVRRRDFLQLLGAAGGTLALAACGGSSNNGAAVKSTATSGAASPSAATRAGSAVAAAPTVAGTPAAQAVKGGTLRVALAMEPPSGQLDANVASTAATHRVIENIYDSLITQTTSFEPRPALATSWDISPDGKVYTFKLRTDVKFHDGTPFNANAVKFNFDRIRDPQTGSTYPITLLDKLDSIDLPDDATVRLNFKAPYPGFFHFASQVFLAFVSPAAVAKYGTDYANHPVGTGPFMFKELVKQDHITLTRNPDYNWGSSVYAHSGPAYLDALTFKVIPESATALGALQAGEVDLVEGIPPADAVKLASNKDYTVFRALMPGQPLRFIFNQSKPPFDDVAARQALLYAVDRDTMIKAFYLGTYPKAEGPLTPTTFAYDKKI